MSSRYGPRSDKDCLLQEAVQRRSVVATGVAVSLHQRRWLKGSMEAIIRFLRIKLNSLRAEVLTTAVVPTVLLSTPLLPRKQLRKLRPNAGNGPLKDSSNVRR